ncbi:MAG TPA: hypothetical protein VG937_21215 [Polyangiaceae bacterium]|nr:hypothetical protein [Polyangiaceae bacterium]
MRRVGRGLLLLLGLCGLSTHCSLLVQNDLAELRCSPDGAIGLPGCDPGQVCVAFRCRACIASEVCGDGIDNDCNGQRDDRCQGGGQGSAGAKGDGDAGGAGGIQGRDPGSM